MTTFERLILISKWITLLIFKREHMTLSALAQEVSRSKENKFSIYSLAINTAFWFDRNHCHNAYVHYRAERRQINRKTRCP